MGRKDGMKEKQWRRRRRWRRKKGRLNLQISHSVPVSCPSHTNTQDTHWINLNTQFWMDKYFLVLVLGKSLISTIYNDILEDGVLISCVTTVRVKSIPRSTSLKMSKNSLTLFYIYSVELWTYYRLTDTAFSGLIQIVESHYLHVYQFIKQPLSLKLDN